MQLVDSHCHLNLAPLAEDLPGVLARARDNGIAHMTVISINWEDYPAVRQLAAQYPQLSCTVGIHPTAEGGHEASATELATAARDEGVIGIGETGLDYHWVAPRSDWQWQRFIRHIEVAREVNKPLIIHTREAADDTMQLLRTHQARDAGGIMHCFAEDWRIAEQALDIGFHISFSGIVTYKSAKAVQEVARKAPLDRILVETDSPYLAPVPHRGKPNQPAHVLHTAQHVADLRGISLEALAEATTANFDRLFPSARTPARTPDTSC